jgi:outer membrane biosynthesis protein TonB
VGSARGAGEIAAVHGRHGGTAGGRAEAGISGGIQVGNLAWGHTGGALVASATGAGETSARAPAAPSARTQASLLAVVRRNAPGIQFCYDRELESTPGLRGKVVAVITVAPSGEVVEARLGTDTLGSASLADCMLARIRAWRFPPADEGRVTFQAPFVFTPPSR